MSWDETQGSGSAITYSEWNEMVPYIKSVINTEGVIKLGTDPSITNISSGSELGTSDSTLVTQNAIKSYVDSQISGEDFWDRAGTTITPSNSNDNLNLSSGSLVTTTGFSDGTFTATVAEINTAFNHVSSDGTDHSYIDQDVTTTGTPTFAHTLIDENGDNIALEIDSEATSDGKYGFLCNTGGLSQVSFGGSTQSTASNLFTRNDTSANTVAPVVMIRQDNSGDDQPALKIQQDCTEDAVQINVSTDGNVAIDTKGCIKSNVKIETKSSDYTLTEADNAKIFHVTGTTTITLPDSLSTGYNVVIKNTGTGTVTLSASTTLNTKDSKVDLNNQYGSATVYHAGSNVWYADGDLE